MMRQLAKQTLACGLHWSGAHRWLGGRGDAPLVLCYHRVVEDVRRRPWCAPAMMVSLATLERQLDWVGRRYDFVDLESLVRAEPGTARPRRPRAAVTFDDGYDDVVRLGIPLLARKGIPAALFVVTDLVGTERLHRHDELYWRMSRWSELHGTAELELELRRLGVDPELTQGLGGSGAALITVKERMLRELPRVEVRRLIDALGEAGAPSPEVLEDLRTTDWETLRALHAGGTLIGSHTRRHCVLPQEDEASLTAELVSSKRELEKRLGAPVEHLSYPDGRFSHALLPAVAAAGYRFAYSTCSHRSTVFPLLTLPRRTFWEGSTAGFGGGFSPSVAACAVSGAFDPLSGDRCDHHQPLAPRGGVNGSRRLSGRVAPEPGRRPQDRARAAEAGIL